MTTYATIVHDKNRMLTCETVLCIIDVHVDVWNHIV